MHGIDNFLNTRPKIIESYEPKVMPLRKDFIFVGLNYLFPGIDSTSDEFLKLAKYCRHQYQNIQTVVLYKGVEDFMRLVSDLGLPDIGEREVIIRNCVTATPTFTKRPERIYPQQ